MNAPAATGFVHPENWSKLTVDERIKYRLDNWENPPHKIFASPQHKTAYQERVRVLRDAIEVRKQKRVPAVPITGMYLTARAGLTAIDVLHHHEKLLQPILDYHHEFQPDVLFPSGPMPGKVWEILDYKVYSWAGHGLPDGHQYQTREGEYMSADDYPYLIRDPSGFWMKRYLPRVLGALEPMRKMANLPSITEILSIAPAVLPFGMPDVQEMLHKLMEAGTEAMKCFSAGQKIVSVVEGEGFPMLLGPPFTTIPFDMIGDVMRGTVGIMKDLYLRPKEIIAACERLVPIVINDIVETCNRLDRCFVTIPLHKGADVFMSDEQYRKFYWPPLRAVVDGLNAEGIVPLLFAEGSYNKRLEIIAEIPKGRVIWFFDQTDMRKVKAVLGGQQCIKGNIPSSLMTVGSLDDLRKYCEDLLELFADTGGFILANGAVIDKSDDDHIRTLIEVVRR